MTEKILQNEGLLHDFFLTTRQQTKIKNAFANTMLTDIKISKDQFTKMIHIRRTSCYKFR